jgi:glycosyltransferase involved in cell wall biosynthesis
LEEAVESFLRQDYGGPRELIIVNDLPDQVLAFEHPGILIVNAPRRFRSVGEKLNAGAALARFDLIAPWLDGDISLPHRLSLTSARIDRETGFYRGERGFSWRDGHIVRFEPLLQHAGCLITRELLADSGGFPFVSEGLVPTMELRFARHRLDSGVARAIDPGETYYIYRQHPSSLHATDAQALTATDRYRAVEQHVHEAIRRGEIPTGRIALSPRWSVDYRAQAGTMTASVVEATPAEPSPAVPFDGPGPPIILPGAPIPDREAQALRAVARSRSPHISVILPTLNERYLERTFRQFVATLPTGSEVIVVDNGTTDGSADFLGRRGLGEPTGSLRHPNERGDIDVTLIREPHPLGVAGSRNRGLEVARGEVVVWSDAHVDLPEHWWQPLLEVLARPEVGLVAPSFSNLGSSNDRRTHGQRIADWRLELCWTDGPTDEPGPVPSVGGGFMAMRRDLAKSVGGFDGGMQNWGAEDLELCIRLWLHGHEVWHDPRVVAAHFFRTSAPYPLLRENVVVNRLRTAMLHFNEVRLARVFHALANEPHFARAFAACTVDDTVRRREQLAASRLHDDDWYFNHPAFADIEMPLRRA